jgi:hypothetical protein
MMFGLHKDKAVSVFIILLALTLLSWLVLYFLLLAPKKVGVLLLLLAFVKVQLIVSQYMELNKAEIFIRIAFWFWTFSVCGISVWIYLH